MAPPLNDPLAQMQGIDLPQAVSPWPVAPGWWALVLTGALLLGLFLWRRFRRRALHRAALAALAEIDTAHQRGMDDRAMAQALSMLLRRLALARHPRREVAGLQGEQWLGFLDRCSGTTGFRSGPGRVLTTLPYGGGDRLDAQALLSLVRQWIEDCT